MKKLRTQEEIMSAWTGDLSQPLVSICCITYNHKAYIEDALKGFLIQETDFPFEVLIHDDASSDGTAEVLREYEERYPFLIKTVYQVENQYSKGLKPNAAFNFPRARGKYCALCEGDDYWIDPKKLQQQMAHMLHDSGCSLTFHSVFHLDAATEQIVKHYRNDVRSRSFLMDELIAGGGGLVPTQSIVVRRDVVETLPEFFHMAPAGDYPLVLAAALKGDVFYIDETMAVYRVGSPHSAMGVVKSLSPSMYMERWVKTVRMLEAFNNESSFKFNKAVRKRSSVLILRAFMQVKSRITLGERLQLMRKYRTFLLRGDWILFMLFVLPIPSNKADVRRLMNRCRGRM